MWFHDVCVIGGGAVGGVFSYFLYRGGFRDIVVYYSSVESLREVSRNNGLTILYRDSAYHVPVTPRLYSEPSGYCRFIVNAVKAYSVEDTVDLAKKIITSDSVILMIQNGFGSLEYYEELFGDKVACGVVFFGATRRNRYTIEYHGGDTVFMGFRRGFRYDLFELANALRKGGCDARVVGDIDLYRWLKLGVNAVINPLTALARATNGVVLSNHGVELARLIVGEVSFVAEKYGYKLDPDRLLKIILRSAENTRGNYSSMAQDILAGRRTEIDYINGYIAKHLGEKSINHVLTLLIHMIEDSVITQ